ncbi:hypothetical protein [Clostridium kluyveri]|uniref:Uncharacterized protein n=2 Tax=Clostridium kluyveri TaxID=1534 RepID=A5N5K3_CLOK5|nr:hypothetical protein [Clostridium kluyveri]EDK32584.1 Conserved hypothetical protein [Clostridium kluyveri DSM 555]BAH05518.1 hypothetical protein CKR_0467 [Clostridium kluyveri NBRC 12016]
MVNSLKASLNVTLGFVPLILLWSISNKLGLILGLVSIVILFIKNVINKNIGIMSCVLLVYFITSNILYFYFQMNFIVEYRYLTSYITLGLMGFISIMIKKPYTMYEAKSGYKKGFGESPLFIEVNILITKIWTTIYLVNAIIELTTHNTITIIVINILIVLGIALSIIIPGLLPEA